MVHDIDDLLGTLAGLRDGLRRVGGCWVLTNHPFLSGRPSRAAELDDLMRYVLDHDDVWTTNLAAVAEHVRALNLSPRTITPPDVAGQ